MSKNKTQELSFKEKFKDKIETMGREGIMGVRKNSENVKIDINDYNDFNYEDNKYSNTKSK